MLGLGHADEVRRVKRVRQLDDVPQPHVRLVPEAVPPSWKVRRVGREGRVEGIHEPEWTVVDGQPEDGHVVRVKDAVSEANALPGGHQPTRALCHFGKPGCRVWRARGTEKGGDEGEHRGW